MAYHTVTDGTLLDEIVRSATGVSVARHVQTLIAEPLDVDMWMGLPEQLISRVVPGLWEAASPMDQPSSDRDRSVQAHKGSVGKTASVIGCSCPHIVVEVRPRRAKRSSLDFHGRTLHLQVNARCPEG